jgi:hypothetical protein
LGFIFGIPWFPSIQCRTLQLIRGGQSKYSYILQAVSASPSYFLNRFFQVYSPVQLLYIHFNGSTVHFYLSIIKHEQMHLRIIKIFIYS